METNNIKTVFAGLELSNPIIASSCSLTGLVSNNKRFAAAGVGAIVLKSLFEEDIIRESAALCQAAHHTEGADYMQAYVASNALNGYLELIKESKANCGSTPIIASINCASNGEWVEYARAIAAAGADAIELNIMTLATDQMLEDGDLESRHIAIVKAVKEVVNIPLIIKLGATMSNHVALISKLQACGAAGFVLFNRAYPLDIYIENMTYTHGSILSGENDLSTPLRHTAIVSAAVKNTTLALSGGVQDGASIVKAILAGASAVEVSSAMYREANRIEEWVAESLQTLAAWQSKHGYESIEEFKGVMNAQSEVHRDSVTRTQFLKHFGTFGL